MMKEGTTPPNIGLKILSTDSEQRKIKEKLKQSMLLKFCNDVFNSRYAELSNLKNLERHSSKSLIMENAIDMLEI